MTLTRFFPSICLLFSLVALIAAGCSKNPQAPAKISGSVSYKGERIKGGVVQFVTKEGTPYSAPISSDGTYSVDDVPDGELVVTVETESVNPERKGAKGKDAAKREKMTQPPPDGRSGPTKVDLSASYTKIPEKYGNAKTSPLTYTATRGRQVHDIELN